MRWNGTTLPPQFIPLLLDLKTFPLKIRKQIAHEIIPKSDDSNASFFSSSSQNRFPLSKTLLIVVEDEEFLDVRRWVEALDDVFEPIPQRQLNDEDSDEESESIATTNHHNMAISTTSQNFSDSTSLLSNQIVIM